jgi:hypothetical protein
MVNKYWTNTAYIHYNVANAFHKYTERHHQARMRKMEPINKPWKAFCMSLRSWDEEDEYQEPTLASFMHESTELGWGGRVSRASLGKLYARVYGVRMRRRNIKNQSWQACCMGYGAGMRRMSIKSQTWQALCMSLRSWAGMRRVSFKSQSWKACCMGNGAEMKRMNIKGMLHKSMELGWGGWVSRANIGKLSAWVHGVGVRRMSIKSQPWQACSVSPRRWDEEDEYQLSRANLGKLYAWV